MADVLPVADYHHDTKIHAEELARKLNEIIELLNNLTSGTTGGTGSAGSGNQYIEFRLADGTIYKILHDGTV